jgi:iron complex transport system substrate-binding protein
MIGRRVLLAGGAAVLAAPARAETPHRIVAVGGAVTECVFALGVGDRVVAVDSTSRFPAAVRGLPQIGYMRALAPEGLISLNADMMLLSADAGPAQALAVLRAAGAPIRSIPEVPTGDGIAAKIRAVADALEVDGRPVADTVLADWQSLDAPIAALRPVRTIFVLSASRGAPLVSGAGTLGGCDARRRRGAERGVRL